MQLRTMKTAGIPVIVLLIISLLMKYCGDQPEAQLHVYGHISTAALGGSDITVYDDNGKEPKLLTKMLSKNPSIPDTFYIHLGDTVLNKNLNNALIVRDVIPDYRLLNINFTKIKEVHLINGSDWYGTKLMNESKDSSDQIEKVTSEDAQSLGSTNKAVRRGLNNKRFKTNYITSKFQTDPAGSEDGYRIKLHGDFTNPVEVAIVLDTIRFRMSPDTASTVVWGSLAIGHSCYRCIDLDTNGRACKAN